MIVYSVRKKSLIKPFLPKASNCSLRDKHKALDLVGLFHGFLNVKDRRVYVGWGDSLSLDGNNTVRESYLEASNALSCMGGFPASDVLDFLLRMKQSSKAVRKNPCWAAGFLANSLILKKCFEDKLKQDGIPFDFKAYAGYGFGFLSAIVASKALSLGDGVKLAYHIASLISENKGNYGVVALKGECLDDVVHRLNSVFPNSTEVFESLECGNLGFYKLYVKQSILDKVMSYIFCNFNWEQIEASILATNIKFTPHSNRMLELQIAVSKFIDDYIPIKQPEAPVVSCFGNGLIFSREGIVSDILDMVSKPLNLSQFAYDVKSLTPRSLIEFGRESIAGRIFWQTESKLPYLLYTDEPRSFDDYCKAASYQSVLNFFSFQPLLDKIVRLVLNKCEEQNDKRTPVIITLEGDSGSGKTTLAGFLLEYFSNIGFKVMVDQYGKVPTLDMFLKPSELRHKLRDKVIEDGKLYYDEIDVFDWKAIEQFCCEINLFRESDKEEIVIYVEDAYDQATRTRGLRYFYLNKKMTVFIEGKNAGLCRGSDINFLMMNKNSFLRFIERSQVLSSKELLVNRLWHRLALTPSFERYLKEGKSKKIDDGRSDYVVDISSDIPDNWAVYDGRETKVDRLTKLEAFEFEGMRAEFTYYLGVRSKELMSFLVKDGEGRIVLDFEAGDVSIKIPELIGNAVRAFFYVPDDAGFNTLLSLTRSSQEILQAAAIDVLNERIRPLPFDQMYSYFHRQPFKDKILGFYPSSEDRGVTLNVLFRGKAKGDSLEIEYNKDSRSITKVVVKHFFEKTVLFDSLVSDDGSNLSSIKYPVLGAHFSVVNENPVIRIIVKDSVLPKLKRLFQKETRGFVGGLSWEIYSLTDALYKINGVKEVLLINDNT